MAHYHEEAAVHHDHHYEERSRNGLGTILSVILLLVVLYFLFIYGLPAIRGAFTAPQVNVPSQMDINVNTPNQGAPAK